MVDFVTTELTKRVFHITLNRPNVHNSFDDGMVESLRQAIEQAAEERRAQFVLLSGSGPSFCSGADIEWMREMGTSLAAENRRSAERLARLFQEIDRLEKPVVGRIHGAAIGGGIGLVALCDIAIAASSTRFAMNEVRLGVIPAVTVPYLIRKIGWSRSCELVLTGRHFGGEEAAAMGLVTRAVDDSLLDAAVHQILSALRRGGPQALCRAKVLHREITRKIPFDDNLAQWTATLSAEARAGDEAQDGLSAYLDKRQPSWLTEEV